MHGLFKITHYQVARGGGGSGDGSPPTGKQRQSISKQATKVELHPFVSPSASSVAARPGLAHLSDKGLDGGAGDTAAVAGAAVVHGVAQHLAERTLQADEGP